MKPGIKQYIAFWVFNNIYVIVELKYQEKRNLR